LEEKEYLFIYFLSINCIVYFIKYSYSMGSNASKSTSAYCASNYSTILRNGTAFKLGDLVMSECGELLLELRRIILLDEILDYIIVDFSLRKSCKISRRSLKRMSVGDLWNTIGGKVVTKIRDEILYNGGVEADTK
jgi:hypothetical protein